MDTSASVREALSVRGRKATIARALGISHQAVAAWQAAGRIPPERVLDVERATDGGMHRSMMRPDIYPAETRPTTLARGAPTVVD